MRNIGALGSGALLILMAAAAASQVKDANPLPGTLDPGRHPGAMHRPPPSRLRDVGDPASTAIVTPYYGYYVLAAMARLNHRPEALAWMRQYWGGMLAEGATSFWEAYDPHWPKTDFHHYLQADGKTGYYVSLAHGWASGPTAWLIEQVLGIEPTARGFAEVTIRPDLAGLAWARGAEPTPRGPIRIEVRADRVRAALPAGTAATILLPFAAGSGTVLEDGRPIAVRDAEGGTRSEVTIRSAGQHEFTLREAQ